MKEPLVENRKKTFKEIHSSPAERPTSGTFRDHITVMTHLASCQLAAGVWDRCVLSTVWSLCNCVGCGSWQRKVMMTKQNCKEYWAELRRCSHTVLLASSWLQNSAANLWGSDWLRKTVVLWMCWTVTENLTLQTNRLYSSVSWLVLFNFVYDGNKLYSAFSCSIIHLSNYIDLYIL